MSANGDNFFKGFLIGGIFGAIAGMLFAPKSGRELREELQDESEKFWDRTRDDIQHARDAAMKTYESSRDAMLDKMAGQPEKKSEATANADEAHTAEKQETESKVQDSEKEPASKPRRKRGRPPKKKPEA